MKAYGRNLKGNAWAAFLAACVVLLGGITWCEGAEPPAANEHETDAVVAPAVPPEAASVSPETNTPAANSESPSPNTKPSESSRRQRLDEVVSVGTSARVGGRQTAAEVVVVYGDATIEGEVKGDVVVVFGKLKIEGSVRGDVVVVLGEAEVNGEIRGSTSLVMSPSRFGPKANVQGDVVAVGVAPEIDASAVLKRSPEVVSLGPLMSYFEGAKDYLLQGVLWLRPFPPRVGWAWIAVGVFLVFHLILALILARPLESCMVMVRDQPARSFLVGLLTCVLVAPVSLLLSFTVIAPLLIWLAFFALCIFGRVAAYGATGAALGRTVGIQAWPHPVVAVLVGSVVLYVCYMIPLVGLMVYGLALPLGVGAVLLRIFDAMKKESPPIAGAPRREGLAAASALASGMPGPATHGFTGTGPAPSASAAAPFPCDPIGSGSNGGPVPPGGSPPPIPPTTPPPFTAPPPISPRVIPLTGMDDLAMPRVGFWPRFGAVLMDLILVAVVNAVSFQSAQAFWFLWAVYHGVLWTWRSTTLGGSVMNLRLVRLDGRAMDWQTAVVRMLGSVVSLVPLGLGFFWASWDSEFQSWHDRIAGTTMVKPERKVSLV